MKNKPDNIEPITIKSFSASVLIHIAVIAVSILAVNFSSKPRSSEFVEVQTKEFISEKNDFVKEEIQNDDEEIADEKESALEEKEIKPKEILAEKKEEKKPAANMSFENADTSSLAQVYSESTLNVSIRYPKGWAFIDQNNNSRLDGVTFWGAASQFNPPPYVHLEVKEKYLFNPKRYKNKLQLDDAVAHYNSPKELAGQVSQEFYIRTETDVDFSLKLIMKGENNFLLFQPDFLGMLKTFRFGRKFL